MMLNTQNYQIQNWNQKFPDGVVNLKDIQVNVSWDDLFDDIKEDKRFDKLEKFLSREIKRGLGRKIFPYPDLVFSAFNYTPLDKLKVVILGQDPYFNFNKKNLDSKYIPEAMGLSFSVPVGVDIPSSLSNVFTNLKKYNNIMKIPKHGNLEFWASQGCLMLNTSLTVEEGQKNGHANEWLWATDQIIKYISEKCDGIVFVLWGSPALSKMNLIDVDKHDVIVSSHPSGLSCHTPLKSYPPFNDCDHFGEINQLLKKKGKDTIVWQTLLK
jgi:uracil-DNA glycosylase